MATVVFVNVWRWTPFMIVMTLAALQTVPEELYDAARVDGASNVQSYRHITLPLIAPAVAGTTFILAIWLFNMFPPIWLMTQGGPVDATTTLPIDIYKQGLQLFRMSDAATISILLLIIFATGVFQQLILHVFMYNRTCNQKNRYILTGSRKVMVK